MFKHIKAFFHSIYFSYVGRFGGEVNGGVYYILWTINIYSDNARWVNIRVYALREINPLFFYHAKRS